MKTVVRWVLAAVCAVAATAPSAWAQAVPPVSHVAIEAPAIAALDSLASIARTQRVETAGCATRYAVQNDTLILSAFTPAQNITRADSANIWSRGPFLCPPGVPAIHAHLTMPGYAWWEPSIEDLRTSHTIGVWEMLLIVSPTGWRVEVY